MKGLRADPQRSALQFSNVDISGVEGIRIEESHWKVCLSFHQLVRDRVCAEDFPQHFHHPPGVHRNRAID